MYYLRGASALSLFGNDETTAEDSFRKLKDSFQKTVRYTNAAYRSQRDIYMNAALKHYQGHHPDMKCKEIDYARGHDAWTIFTDTMQCRRDESVMSVPDNVIELLNREKRREALLGLDNEIKQQMSHAASLLNAQATATVWQCVQSICNRFGFKQRVKKYSCTINGTYHRNLFQTIELCRELPFVEHWSLYDSRVCPGRFVNIGEWARHEEELDIQAIEDIYERDTDCLPQTTLHLWTPLGTYEELVHKDTLVELTNAEPPPFPEDLDGQQQRKKWNSDQKRLQAMLDDHGINRDDGALVLRLPCYKKYGHGRRIMAFPSLQACPKIHRGPLAYRYCHDLDIENAHYSMMRQIAVEHGTTLACVDYYCNNTQVCRQRVQDFYGCTKKAAKQLLDVADLFLNTDLIPPLRNNYTNLRLITPDQETLDILKESNSPNYVVVDSGGFVTLVINKFKTDARSAEVDYDPTM
eukprot:COSAG01_NODE_5395_length_4290_cov_5.110475_1_plen_466_part_10